MKLAGTLSTKYSPQSLLPVEFDSEETESLTFLFSQTNVHEKENSLQNTNKVPEGTLPQIFLPKHK